jgi:hypothetical protein
MKKLFIVTLVLGMASAANAALSIVGPTEINEGDTVSIGINSTDAGPYIAYLAFGYVSEGGFELSNPRYLWPPVGIPPLPPDPIVVDDVIYYEVDFGMPSDPFPEFPPGIWFTIDLTCMSAGVDVFVELLDSDWATTLDRLIIHQVPEPMTIALLGLGGLLALRRRK